MSTDKVKLVIYAQGEVGYGSIEELNEEAMSDKEANLRCIYAIRSLRNALTDPTVDWQLSIRASNVLRRNNLCTVRKLEEMRLVDIVRIPRCGMKVVDDVCQEAARHGVDLPNWRQALIGKYKTTVYNDASKENAVREMEKHNYDE